jgi:hypothetical protein
VDPVGLTLIAWPAQPGHLVLQETGDDKHPQFERHALQGVLHEAEQLLAIRGELDLAAGGAGGDSRLGRLGLLESCRFAQARFKAVPPSSSREKPRPVKRPDGRNRPLHFSTTIGTTSTTNP